MGIIFKQSFYAIISVYIVVVAVVYNQIQWVFGKPQKHTKNKLWLQLLIQ